MWLKLGEKFGQATSNCFSSEMVNSQCVVKSIVGTVMISQKNLK